MKSFFTMKAVKPAIRTVLTARAGIMERRPFTNVIAAKITAASRA
jgi:hypothetical protein